MGELTCGWRKGDVARRRRLVEGELCGGQYGDENEKDGDDDEKDENKDEWEIGRNTHCCERQMDWKKLR